MHDWFLLGTGPSGQACAADIPAGSMIATTNGGAALAKSVGRKVNAYGVFELKAAVAYQSVFGKLQQDRGCICFVRPGVREFLSAERRAVVLPKTFGPDHMRDLHEDRWFKPEDPDVPEYGQSGSWMSSGVLMLWAISHIFAPSRIQIAGLDSYQPGDPNPVSGYERTPEWCAFMNTHMADAIERITRFYTDTQYEFLTKPPHARKEWRARYLKEK